MAILPGSRRYLGEQGIAGDNTDVRGPEPDEVWKGGIIFGSATGGGGHCTPALPIKSVTLILDGVFFLDGEFAGPDRNGLWEKVTVEAKSVMDVAHADGIGHPTAEILRQTKELTGSTPKLPPVVGDERTVDGLASLTTTPLPNYRRRVAL